MDKNFEVLKHGHKYVTRGGEVVTVAALPECCKTYPFLGVQNGETYTATGRTYEVYDDDGKDRTSYHDIVAEYKDDLATTLSGVKLDTGKADLTLLPQAGLLEAARVMTQAQSKYPIRDNWKHLDDGENRTIAASLRHINQHLQGNITDEESGLPHLAHAAVNILMAIELFEGDHIEDLN